MAPKSSPGRIRSVPIALPPRPRGRLASIPGQVRRSPPDSPTRPREPLRNAGSPCHLPAQKRAGPGGNAPRRYRAQAAAPAAGRPPQPSAPLTALASPRAVWPWEGRSGAWRQQSRMQPEPRPSARGPSASRLAGTTTRTAAAPSLGIVGSRPRRLGSGRTRRAPCQEPPRPRRCPALPALARRQRGSARAPAARTHPRPDPARAATRSRNRTMAGSPRRRCKRRPPAPARAGNQSAKASRILPAAYTDPRRALASSYSAAINPPHAADSSIRPRCKSSRAIRPSSNCANSTSRLSRA